MLKRKEINLDVLVMHFNHDLVCRCDVYTDETTQYR
jgi:hypothetical protein